METTLWEESEGLKWRYSYGKKVVGWNVVWEHRIISLVGVEVIA